MKVFISSKLPFPTFHLSWTHTPSTYSRQDTYREESCEDVLSSLRFLDFNGNMGVVKCPLLVRIPFFLLFCCYLLGNLLVTSSIFSIEYLLYQTSLSANALNERVYSILVQSTTKIWTCSSLLWTLHAWIQIHCALNPQQLHF